MQSPKSYIMVNSKRGVFGTLSLIVVLMLLGACSSKQRQGKAEDTDEPLSVNVISPRVDSIVRAESFSATVESFVKNNIAPQSPNRIQKIYVEVGQKVNRGQVLATLDRAQLTQLELKQKKSKLDLDRIDQLYQVGGISKSDWENARMAYEVENTTLQNIADNTRLVSPISGIITARNYDSGDMYSPQMPLLVVEQISPLKININMSEEYFPVVKKGLPVEVRLDVFPDEVFEAEVGLVYPSIDPATRTFGVEVHLKNSDSRIRPGMYAHVNVKLGEEEALLIPDTSVRTLPGTAEKMVYIYRDGKAILRKVELGRLVDSDYIVKSGIELGDQVITSGLSRLKNGMPVRVSSSQNN